MKRLRRSKTQSSRVPFRRVGEFLKKNFSLIIFTVLLLIGTALGCTLYSAAASEKRQMFMDILSYYVIPRTVAEGCLAVISASFYTVAVLAVVFLFGLTSYGAPLVLCVPLFFGFCIGIVECNLYSTSGIIGLLVDFLPHMMISVVALLIGCVQALRMSVLFSRQLLPNGAHCGGMWQDFKLYLLRFLFCLFLTVLASSLNVMLQIV